MMRSLLSDLRGPEPGEGREALCRMERLCRISQVLFQRGKGLIRPPITTGALAMGFAAVLDSMGEGNVSVYSLHINVNEQAFHCPPGTRIIAPGDILTVDIVLSDGTFFSDGAWTYGAGELAPPRRALLEQAWRTSCAAVLAVKARESLAVMQTAVEESLKGTGYRIVPEACGHGIGRRVHEEPEIPFVPSAASHNIWKENFVCTVEPVVLAGEDKIIEDGDRGFISQGGADTAYFEHTLHVQSGKTTCLNIPEINPGECIDIFRGFI